MPARPLLRDRASKDDEPDGIGDTRVEALDDITDHTIVIQWILV